MTTAGAIKARTVILMELAELVGLGVAEADWEAEDLEEELLGTTEEETAAVVVDETATVVVDTAAVVVAEAADDEAAEEEPEAAEVEPVPPVMLIGSL